MFAARVGGIIAAEHLGRHVEDQPTFRRLDESRFRFVLELRRRRVGVELLESARHELLDAVCLGDIGERKQLALGREDIDACE